MLIEKNIYLNGIFLVFVFGTFAYRYWDVFFKSYGKQGRIYYRWTLSFLGLIHSLIGVLALAEYFFVRTRYNLLIGLVALIVFILGQLVRNWAISALGEFHSPHIEIKPGHKLIKEPPYNHIRHPYYLGVIIEVLSSPLVLNAYLTFAFGILFYLPVLFVRIYLEEKILARDIGFAYQMYQRIVGSFVPGCILKSFKSIGTK